MSQLMDLYLQWFQYAVPVCSNICDVRYWPIEKVSLKHVIFKTSHLHILYHLQYRQQIQAKTTVEKCEHACCVQQFFRLSPLAYSL